MMSTMQRLDPLPKIQVNLEQKEFDGLGIQPWFSYQANLPERPLPPVSARVPIQTARLIVRPLQMSDLDAFHDLRRDEAQAHSTFRGHPDKDVEATRRDLTQLQAPYDERHWYFGAFLASTGELIGEGGIPDCEHQPTSGWTRCEILVKQGFQRQGFGTELFRAVMDSWWELPRERRRHQLLPLVAGDHEPGDTVTECVEFVWAESNVAAQHFFAKMLGQAPVSAEGTFVSFDWREGHFGELGRWAATLAANPRAVQK